MLSLMLTCSVGKRDEMLKLGLLYFYKNIKLKDSKWTLNPINKFLFLKYSNKSILFFIKDFDNIKIYLFQKYDELQIHLIVTQ